MSVYLDSLNRYTDMDRLPLDNPYIYDYNFYGGGSEPVNDSYKNIDYMSYIKPAVGLIGDIFKSYTQYDTSKKIIGLENRQLSQRENELEFFKTQKNIQKEPIRIPPIQGGAQDRYIPMPISPTGGYISSGNGISSQTMLIMAVAGIGLIFLLRSRIL